VNKLFLIASIKETLTRHFSTIVQHDNANFTVIVLMRIDCCH